MSDNTIAAKYACPKCSSENIQLFSMIFQSGTSTSTSHTSGVGLNNDGGMGVFGAQTSTASSTLLANQVAPPVLKKMTLAGIAMGLGGIFIFRGLGEIGSRNNEPPVIVLLLIVGFGLAFIGFYFFKKNKRYNREEFPRLYTQWEHSWKCHKCGHVFQLS